MEAISKQHRHHCSREHIHTHTEHPNENINSSNLRKSAAGSQSNIPPKKRTVTEKFPLELNALQQQLEYYQKELARVEHESGTQRTASEDVVLKSELQRANRERAKLKKEHQTMSKEQEKLVKKLNDLEAKVKQDNREIQSLRTIQDSRREKKQTSNSKKKTANPEQTSKGGLGVVQSIANLHGLPVATAFQQLQQQNRLLRERLLFFENSHKQTESTFQPILRENASQIRQLIADKGRLAKDNVELKQKAQSFESSSKHFEQKYKSVQAAFAKLKGEYEKATKALAGSTRIDPSVVQQDSRELQQLKNRLKQSEGRLQQMQAANQNHRNRIAHLESTNRYLVTENRKLSSNGGSQQPSSVSQNYY